MCMQMSYKDQFSDSTSLDMVYIWDESSHTKNAKPDLTEMDPFWILHAVTI